MSEEQGYIIVTLGSDSDNSNNNDDDDVIIINSESEDSGTTENSSLREKVIQGGGDNQLPSQMSNDMRGTEENNQGSDLVPVLYPVVWTTGNGQYSSTPSHYPTPEPVRKQTCGQENTQMVNNPPPVESNAPGFRHAYYPANTDELSYILQTTLFNLDLLTPIMSGHDTDETTDNSEDYDEEPGITQPVLENDNGQTIPPSFDRLPVHIGYIGDPKRNVTILKMHLMNAQRKPEPKRAARYLARALFSKEVLVCSSVSTNPHVQVSRVYPPLDPNKMAAIREYVETIFPNRDLSEYGKEWKACISYIKSLICYYRAEARKAMQATVGFTNPNAAASPAADDGSDADGPRSNHQLEEQEVAPRPRESGNADEEPSTSGAAVPCRVLKYIGCPRRNVRLSQAVVETAKKKTTPQKAARYLLTHLFSKEALLTCNFYGKSHYGPDALNANKIDALREFLEDNYPTHDLTKDGCVWKMCLLSVNSAVRNLRYMYKKATTELQPTPPTVPVIILDSSDSDSD